MEPSELSEKPCTSAEEGTLLNRNRSIKSKLLVRSQAIRESQSPPRTVSPSFCTDITDSSKSPIPQNDSSELNSDGTDSLNRKTNPNCDVNKSTSDRLIGAESNCYEVDEKVKNDGNSEWTEVRKSHSDSQVSSQIIDNQRQLQRVEIQITSGACDSDQSYTDHSRNMRSKRWLSGTRPHNTDLLSNNPRVMCVCGGCGERRRCLDCRGKIRPVPLCTAKQDSGIGCSVECADCDDSPEPLASPNNEPPNQTRHRSKSESNGDDHNYCRCPEEPAPLPKTGSLTRTDSEERQDLSDTELVKFIRKTLNQNSKERCALFKIERELISLVNDNSRCVVRFPPVAAYGRLLIHRSAALFQLRHTIDYNNKSIVVVSKTGTCGGRIPCTSFRQWCTVVFPVTQDDMQAKSILKRDAHSLDETTSSSSNNINQRSKSFEQREVEYERARRRIFSSEDCTEESQWPWLSTGPVKLLTPDTANKQGRLLKVQSLEGQLPPTSGRGAVSKSHSFGGYGNDQIQTRILSRQGDLASSSWRLSPSSSGYKTLSLRSMDSVTPSPTGGVSPEPSGPPTESSGVPAFVFAVTDLSTLPPGSLIIHPQTGRPLTNLDGSVYHYDPAQPPAIPVIHPDAQAANCDMTVRTPEKRRGRLEKQNSFIDTECECQAKNFPPQNCCACCDTKAQLDWSYQCVHTNTGTAEPDHHRRQRITDKGNPPLADSKSSIDNVIESVTKYDPNLIRTNQYIVSPHFVQNRPNFVPNNANFTPNNANFVPSNANFAPINANFVPNNADFVPSNPNVVPDCHNFISANAANQSTLQSGPTNQMQEQAISQSEFKPANQIEGEQNAYSEYGPNYNSNMVHYALPFYPSHSYRTEEESPQNVTPPYIQDIVQVDLTQKPPPYDPPIRTAPPQCPLTGVVYPTAVNPLGHLYTNHCRMEQTHPLYQTEERTPSPQLEVYPVDPAAYYGQPLMTPENVIQNTLMQHQNAAILQAQNGVLQGPYQGYVGYAGQYGHAAGCAGACGVEPASGLAQCVLQAQRAFGAAYGQPLDQSALTAGATYPVQSVLLPQAGATPAAVHNPYQYAAPAQWSYPIIPVQTHQKPPTPPLFLPQTEVQYIPKVDFPNHVYVLNQWAYPHYVPVTYPMYHQPVYQGVCPNDRRHSFVNNKFSQCKFKPGSGCNSSRGTPLNVGTPPQEEAKQMYTPYEQKFDNKEMHSPLKSRLVKQSSYDSSNCEQRRPLRTNSVRSNADPIPRQDSSNSFELAAKIQLIKEQMSLINVSGEGAWPKADRERQKERSTSGSILGNYPLQQHYGSGRIMINVTPPAGDGSQITQAAQTIVNSIRSMQGRVHSANIQHVAGNQSTANISLNSPPPHYRHNDSGTAQPDRPHDNKHYKQEDGDKAQDNQETRDKEETKPELAPENFPKLNIPARFQEKTAVVNSMISPRGSTDQRNTPHNSATDEKNAPLNLTADQRNTTLTSTTDQKNTPHNSTAGQRNITNNSATDQKNTSHDSVTGRKNTSHTIPAEQRNTAHNSTTEQRNTPHNLRPDQRNILHNSTIDQRNRFQENIQLTADQGNYYLPERMQNLFRDQRERTEDRRPESFDNWRRFEGQSQDMRVDGQFLQRNRSFNQMVPYQFGRPYMIRQMTAGSLCRRSPGPVSPFNTGFNPRYGPRRPAPDTRRR